MQDEREEPQGRGYTNQDQGQRLGDGQGVVDEAIDPTEDMGSQPASEAPTTLDAGDSYYNDPYNRRYSALMAAVSSYSNQPNANDENFVRRAAKFDKFLTGEESSEA